MHRKGKMMRKVRLGTEINDAPSSSQRPGLAGPGRCRDSPSEVRAWVWSEAGLGSPPPPSPGCVTLQLLCVPGPQFLHVERGVVGAPTPAGREDCAARCSLLSITASTGLHTNPAETRADVGGGVFPMRTPWLRPEGPRAHGPQHDAPLVSRPWCLGQSRGTSHGTLTHVVKHLALGGAVLLCDGIGHCVRAHEQRVPVVGAEGRNREVGLWLSKGDIFSDVTALRNELTGLPFSAPKSSSSPPLK